MIEPRYVVATRERFVHWCYEQGIDPRDRSRVVRVGKREDAVGISLESATQVVYLDGDYSLTHELRKRVEHWRRA